MLLVAVLSAAPIKVALPVLRGVAVSAEALDFYTQHLARELSDQGVQAVTARDMDALLGLERQKQLMGCSEGSSACMAELAGALGVEVVLLGDVARIGSVVQVNLRALAADDGRVVASATERVTRDEQVLDALAREAAKVAAVLRARHAPPGTVAEPPPPLPGAQLSARSTAPPSPTARPEPSAPGSTPALKQWAWLPLAGGAVIGLGGGGLLWVARDRHERLTGPTAAPVSLAEAQSLAAQGQAAQLGGWTAVGVGGAAVALGAAALLWPDPSHSVALAVGRDGAGVLVRGAFP